MKKIGELLIDLVKYNPYHDSKGRFTVSSNAHYVNISIKRQNSGRQINVGDMLMKEYKAKNSESMAHVGRVESARGGGFHAIEQGTNKHIGPDGKLAGGMFPPTYKTEAEAHAAIKARDEHNKAYAAGNTPKAQAEKAAEKERAKAAKAAEHQKNIAAAQVEMDKTRMLDGWSHRIDEKGVHLSGPYNEEMPKRLKRLGGKWNVDKKEWTIPHENAGSLRRVFSNAEKSKASKAEAERLARLSREEEKERKIFERNKKSAEEAKRKEQAILTRVKVPHGKYKIGDTINGKTITGFGSHWEEGQKWVQVTDENSSAYGMQPGLDRYPRIKDPYHKPGKYNYAYFKNETTGDIRKVEDAQ